MKRKLFLFALVAAIVLFLFWEFSQLKKRAETPSVFTESTSVSLFHPDAVFVNNGVEVHDEFVVYAKDQLMEYNAQFGETCVVHAVRIGQLYLISLASYNKQAFDVASFLQD